MAGRALAQWRQDLIRDLGGDVSTRIPQLKAKQRARRKPSAANAMGLYL